MAEKYLVEGYEFDTLDEATQARKELQAVKYLSQRTDNASDGEIYKIYNKIIEENLFKTQIGLDYVRAIEEYLMQCGLFEIKEESAQADEESTVETDNGHESEVNELTPPESKKTVDEQVKILKDRLTFSVALNIILAVCILAMIYIASTSSNVNILNYETKIQDKYSGWAEKLKEKESQIKEREKTVTEAEKKEGSISKQIAELEERLKMLQDEVQESENPQDN